MKKLLSPNQTRAEFVPSSFNAEENSIEIVFATQAKVLRRTWDGSYNEVLICDETAVRMDRLNAGAAVVDTHNTWSLSSQLGVVERAWVKGGKCYAKVRFSTREEVRGFIEDIKNGIIRNVSVGYRVYKYEEISDKEIKEYRALDWEPYEITFCPVPADFTAGTRSLDTTENEVEIIISNKNTRTMPENTTQQQAAAPAAEPVVTAPQGGEAVRSAEDAEKKGAALERQRQKDIRDLVRAVSLEDSYADELIDGDKTVDEARKLIIAKKADSQKGNNVRGHIHNITVNGPSEGEKTRGAIEYALMHRADNAAFPLTDEKNPDAVLARQYQGISVADAARMLLISRGESVGYGKAELIARAMTTSDFPALMSAIGNKFLRREYQQVSQTFKAFARQQNLPDFKETKGIQFGGTPTLEKVLEDGEYKSGTFQETEDGWKLATYGKMFKFSRQMMINDDLGAFRRQAVLIARSAANLEDKMVWNLIVSNVVMSDAKALFHADHKNLKASAGTLDVAGLSLARTAMRRQKGLNEEELIEVAPKFLVVPPELETTAEQLVAGIVANATGSVNPFSGKLQVLSTPRLTNAKEWYLFADFSMLDGITYGYLEGQEGLHTETRESWQADGVEIKARIDFGVKAWDYRGFYKTVMP